MYLYSILTHVFLIPAAICLILLVRGVWGSFAEGNAFPLLKPLTAIICIVAGFNLLWPPNNVIGRWTGVSMHLVRFVEHSKDGPITHVEWVPNDVAQ